MHKFEELWNFIKYRCPLTVQNESELHHIFDLMSDCNSYLEVGTAEGNSLYVLGHSLKESADITYIDFDESHTCEFRNSVIEKLKSDSYAIRPIHGNSHEKNIIEQAWKQRYDCVLIDAGHKYIDVIMDARNYGPLADKYIFFHDVQLPDVMEAFNTYKDETGYNGYTFINSETFGYGILEV